MKRIIITIIFCLALSPMAAFAGGIEGVYNCQGANPSGQGNYKGAVSIIKNGDVYQITWNIGAQTYMGVGILEENTFSVGYASSDKSWFGIVVYKVSGNTLTGKWTMNGGKKLGTETLTRR